MHARTLRKTALVAALGLCLASLAALQPAAAASNDGALTGQLLGAGDGTLEGATVTVRNTETGLTRTVRADADGVVFENALEANNAAAAPVFFDVMPIPYADLVVDSVTPQAPGFSGQPLEVTWTVRNIGIGLL